MKKLSNFIWIACLTCIIAGCQHTPKTPSHLIPKGTTAESVIKKAKAVLGSEERDKQIKTLEYEASTTRIGDITYVKLISNVKYYREKPDKYRYIAETDTDTHSGKRKINTIECTKVGEKYIVKENGKKPYDSEDNEQLFNALKNDVKNFKIHLSLGIYQDFLETKLSKKLSKVNGNYCYKINVILNKRMSRWAGNKLTYYVDSKTYFIRKVAGLKGISVKDIKYRTIDGVTIPERYTEIIENAFGKKITSYYLLKKYIINPEFKVGFFTDNENVTDSEAGSETDSGIGRKL
jgi:hypothetical protein